MARKRVTATQHQPKDPQAWVTLAKCLGYHTQHMQRPAELHARTIININITKEDPHVGQSE